MKVKYVYGFLNGEENALDMKETGTLKNARLPDIDWEVEPEPHPPETFRDKSNGE